MSTNSSRSKEKKTLSLTFNCFCLKIPEDVSYENEQKIGTISKIDIFEHEKSFSVSKVKLEDLKLSIMVEKNVKVKPCVLKMSKTSLPKLITVFLGLYLSVFYKVSNVSVIFLRGIVKDLRRFRDRPSSGI